MATQTNPPRYDRKSAGRGSPSHQSGSALLTVLWLTAALSAIAFAVATNVRGETERAATNVDDAKAYFAAQGGVSRALLHMEWGYNYYKPNTPSFDFNFPTAQVHVAIIPETSKLNLNSAPAEEIYRLLVALRQPEDKASEITAAILDWRTYREPSSSPSPFDAFYLQQSPSFLPAHASFIQNEDLLLVKGITPDLYYGTSLDGSRAGLRDCLSIYGSPAVDINTARAETMIAIGISPPDAQTIAASRAAHPVLEYPELTSIQQSLGEPGARLRLGGNSLYNLRATARLRQPDGQLSDLRRTVSALIKYNAPGNKQNKAPGYEIARWYDRY